MGDEADDIFKFFGLSETERKSGNVVMGKFDSHFVEWKQEVGKSVDTFIISMYAMAEYLPVLYNALNDVMIN